MSRPITRLEIEAILRREVKYYMSLDFSKAEAIQRVAFEQGIDPEWVAQLVDDVPGGEA
jgi:hypothetical protein